MNRYSRLDTFQDCDLNFSVYHKYGRYTTAFLYICKRSYRSGAKIRSFDKWQLEKSQIKDCRFDRIGRLRKNLRAEKLAEYDDLLLCFHGGEYAIQKPTRVNQKSIMHFVFEKLLGMDVDSICYMDGSCRTRDNAGHNWYFLKTMTWMRDHLPNLTAVSVHPVAYLLQLVDTDLNVEDFPHPSTANYDSPLLCAFIVQPGSRLSLALRSLSLLRHLHLLHSAPQIVCVAIGLRQSICLRWASSDYCRPGLEGQGIHGNC